MAQPTVADLPALLATALEPRPEILEAYLFGSQGAGTAGPLSDVDVAVYVDRSRADDSGYGYVARLTADLMTALSRNDVDVVLLNDAPPLLYQRVLASGARLLSRDLAATTTREGRALSRYCDDLPRLAIVERALRSPGRPDIARVLEHLRALDVAVRQLRRHSGKPLEVLRDDLDEAWAVERGLLLCAQNVLDVATHLAASAGCAVRDYNSAIDALADIGVLPRDFAASLRALGGFRNILVHGYLDLDLARVHEFLNGRLDDFVEFARAVEAYLARS
jgi:uncharacterized protein YutE (UPF0331/DUF86 family)/predicted nucleotidyltransferase